MSNTSSNYTRRRGVPLKQIAVYLTEQNYVNLRAMARATGETLSQRLDALIEGEVSRHARKVAKRKLDAPAGGNVASNI